MKEMPIQVRQVKVLGVSRKGGDSPYAVKTILTVGNERVTLPLSDVAGSVTLPELGDHFTIYLVPGWHSLAAGLTMSDGQAKVE